MFSNLDWRLQFSLKNEIHSILTLKLCFKSTNCIKKSAKMLSHLKSINTAQIWLATSIVMLGIVFQPVMNGYYV